MSFATWIPVVLGVGIALVPVWVLRRREGDRALDALVASQYTRPEVVRNASIAYALRMVAFAALFAWGAGGDFWPAIIAATAFALGIALMYALRRPLLDFVDRALSADGSITVHAFIAQAYGDDSRVRVVAASMAVLALVTLLAADALALAAFAGPMFADDTAVRPLVVGGLLLAALPVLLAGHSGVMHFTQLLLGMLYLGLFGLATLLLYLQVSALAPMPAHGTFAFVMIAAFAAMLVAGRRSRYVDTARLCGTRVETGREPLSARLVSRFAKILNVVLSVELVAIVVIAAMQLYATGVGRVLQDSAAALSSGTRQPVSALIALGLLTLLHPIVDVTNWQRLAALRKDTTIEPRRRSAVLSAVLRSYAAETCVVALFIAMFGAIAVITLETPGEGEIVRHLAAQLADVDKAVASVVSSLSLLCVVAVALSTMSALYAACVCTIRYDLLDAFKRELVAGQRITSIGASAGRRTVIAVAGLWIASATAFWIADASLQRGVGSSTIVAVMLAFCCAQLALAPLVLGALGARTRGNACALRPVAALVVLVAGAGAAIAAFVVYGLTGSETWLWASVPVCAGSGFMTFFVARIAARRRASRAGA